MNKYDIAYPHRLLINQSLRKEVEKLRVHIDEYKERYDAHYQKNIEELESVRDQLNSEYEQAQKAIIDTLSSDVEVMQEISDAIAAYVSAYFDRQLAYKKKEINAVQMKIVEEYIGFLSEQMSEISSEIDILRSRIELLSREADITDILHLVQLSGEAFSINEVNNAKELLEIVKQQMDAAYEENSVTWYSLLNLRTILEERTSFLTEIQYITWVIEQKIQFSKELRVLREEQYRLQSNLITEAETLQGEIEDLSSILWTRAKEIRFYWARPMVFIGADIEESLSRIKSLKGDIAEYSEKRKALYRDKERIQQDIDRMKEEHSSDSFKWDRLQREKRDVSEEIRDIKSKMDSSHSEIELLNTAISSLKTRRSSWNARRKTIQDLLWKYSVPLLRIIDNDQTDDATFADIRLEELVLIETEGKEAAEKEYQRKLKKLYEEIEVVSGEREVALSKIRPKFEAATRELQIAAERLEAEKQSAVSAAKARVAVLKRLLAEQQTAVEFSQKKLADIQKADTRIVVLRWFSDTPEESKAKAVVASLKRKVKETESELIPAEQKVTSGSFADVPEVVVAQKAVDSVQARILEISANMESIQKPFDAHIAELETEIKGLKLTPERPTSEERSEMRKIKTWIESRQKRVRHRKEYADDSKD